MNKYFKLLTAIIIGAIGGFGFYYFVGCNAGTCMITSKPINSTTYGAFIGLIWYLPDFWTKKGIK
ncbi:MAG: hypothetical protein H8E85_02900 [Candidatus Marinimicrobia bacterium]|nr:hypothetical protein [Candidatus Neomarinimicrobiota bacterium]